MKTDTQGPTRAQFRAIREAARLRDLNRVVDELVRVMGAYVEDDDLLDLMKAAIVQHAVSFKDVYGS